MWPARRSLPLSITPGSITELLEPLRAGDPIAQERAFRRLWRPVLTVAERRQPLSPVSDSEDVAQEALHLLIRGFERSGFLGIRGRSELFALLWKIVIRRVIIERRKARAARRDVRRQESVEDLDLRDLAVSGPSAEEMLAFVDERDRIMREFERVGIRAFVEESISGWTHEEIGAHLGCSGRTVDRKLAIAREILEREMGRDGV
jgi:DNA-directed RNA polymerase specialized sigma24 family protein